MSVRAMSWAWDRPVGSNQKLVLLRLADHANDEGLCWPSQDTMHVKCGIGERTVRDCLSALEACGLISRQPRWRNGRRTTDLIRLNMLAAESAGSDQGVRHRPLPADNTGSKPATSAGSEPADSAASQPAESSQNNRRDLPGNPKKEEPPRTEPEKKDPPDLSSRRELVELSNRLAEGIRQNDAKAPVNPTSHAWLDPLRLLIDRDGRTVEEVEAVIDWCVADDFNRKTVLSPRRLRTRFPELALKADVSEPVKGMFEFRRRRPRKQQTHESHDSWADEHPPTPELAAEWAPIAEVVAASVGDSYDIWLAPLHLHAASSDEFVLGHPKPEAIGWITNRFGRILLAAAGRPIRIVSCDCEQAVQAA